MTQRISKPTPECFNYDGFDLTVMSIEELKYMRSDQLDNAEISADDYDWLSDEIQARIEFLEYIASMPKCCQDCL
jgi:hypothetical protein